MKRMAFLLSFLFLFVAISCDDDDSNNNNQNNNNNTNNQTCNCGISIVSINDTPIDQINFLTMTQDDQNTEMPGFQVNVKVTIDQEAECVPPEESQIALMGGVKTVVQNLSGTEITFSDYTIPTGGGTLQLQASVPNCQSDKTSITLTSEGVPQCQIVGGISTGERYNCDEDDDVSGQLGLQRLITVNCVDVDPGTSITFSVDGNVQTTAEVAANHKAEAVVTFPVSGVCLDSVTVSISGEFEGETLSDLVTSGRSCCEDALSCAISWRENIDYVTGTPVGRDTLNMVTDLDATTVGHQSSFELHVVSAETTSISIMADDGNGYTEICSADTTTNTITLNCTVPDGVIAIKPVCKNNQNNEFEDMSQVHQVYVDTVPPINTSNLNCQVANPHEVSIACEFQIPASESETIYASEIKFTNSYDATSCANDEQGLFANSWATLSLAPGSDTFDATGNAGDTLNYTFSPFTPGNGYCLGVRLVDIAGNLSVDSVPLVWTPILPDTNLLVGFEDDAQFGNSVTTADLNCDGYKDLIVGAPVGSYEGSEFRTGNGKAYVYFAKSTGGYDATPSLTITLDPAVYTSFDSWAYLGNSVAGIGNFTRHIDSSNDSSSCEDVAIASLWINLPTWLYFPGAVYILKGRPTWSATVITTSESQEGGFDLILRYIRHDGNYADESKGFYEEFGTRVASIGDFNGDGYGDIAISAPGAMPSGAVYILNSTAVPFKDGVNPPTILEAPYDMDATLLGTANIGDTANTNYEWLGWKLSALGDVNGDGFDDVLIGAPGGNGWTSQEGKAFILKGGFSGTIDTATYSGTALILITQDANIEGTESFGWAVAGIGDFNDDGFVDFAISDKMYNRPSTSSYKEGAVFVFFGSSEMYDATILTTASASLKLRSEWDLSSTGQNDYFGMSLAPSVETVNTNIGDFNNDGIPDLLIGSRRFGAYHGSIFIWYGNSSYTPDFDPNSWITYENATFWFTPPSKYGEWGSVVRWIGDINGDGYSDLAIGDPSWDAMYHGSAAEYPNRGRVSIFY